ncbi:hypothetical protein BD769DRAFT_1673044 [Suillus cothurnatus]|nr:hypothetical protein BD769DRAFT_1673044 [Suillus cothurnatus]
MSNFTAITLRSVLHHCETAWFFTEYDFKTLIFPMIVYATVVSPRPEPLALACTVCWLWFHLFQFNVSNQSYSADEDIVHKPWRPLPSGRISVEDSRTMRWTLLVFCLGLSSIFSLKLFMTSGVFTVLMVLHDNLRNGHYHIFGNLCNVAAYVTAGVGCSLILSGESSLDGTSIKALSCGALVILLTIHAQDFADVDGDEIC